jgi:ppGpp synthetase/RelA/SpoT-type nucleotidyltranferase
MDDQRVWAAEQIEAYAELHPHYRRYAEVLEAVLRTAADRVAPLAIVQVRAKAVHSFAEKALRKRSGRPDPVHMFTDLCGARLIGRTRSEVDALGRFVVDSFEIDWENSVDASQRLRPTEFGYRSVHYIVQFRTGVDYGVAIPDEIRGLKAEVQLRTVAEHAYCDFAHDLTYKGAFSLPLAWQRELAGVAATLEEVDGVFARVEEGLRTYASSYGAYLGAEETRAEIERLLIVLEHDALNTELADRVGRLALAIGDFQRVTDVLSRFVTDDTTARPRLAPLLRDLGTSLCQMHQDEPAGVDYRRGQRYLERAADSDDLEAICAFANTLKGTDDAQARSLYRRAFELDPADPGALVNYLELELDRHPSLLESVRPLLRRAIERCERHIQAGVNLPWAHFQLGQFHLLLDEPYEALAAYASAIETSTAAFMVEASLASLERLATALGERRGFDWARRLLLLGLTARLGSATAHGRIEALRSPGEPPFGTPVVIVAGGTDPIFQEHMLSYADLLTAAFADFEGTILSGGTTQGICGLVGEIGRASGGRVHTVGYLPGLMPADATVDPAYTELRRTGGSDFSPLEPLQNWVDLMASGVPPASVRVLGINGGRIAAAEYRIALALGATVGLVADSGREAGRLLGDEAWTSRRLVRLPPDRDTLRAFVTARAASLPEPTRDTLARAIHERFRQEQGPRPDIDPALAGWEQLSEDFRNSNREQADDIAAKLRRVGLVITAEDAPGEAATFRPEELEELAEMEHGRWTVERLLGGWTLADRRDPARRESPYLVAWSALPEDIREIDRQAVRRIPDLLARVGLAARRQPPP